MGPDPLVERASVLVLDNITDRERLTIRGGGQGAQDAPAESARLRVALHDRLALGVLLRLPVRIQHRALGDPDVVQRCEPLALHRHDQRADHLVGTAVTHQPPEAPAEHGAVGVQEHVVADVHRPLARVDAIHLPRRRVDVAAGGQADAAVGFGRLQRVDEAVERRVDRLALGPDGERPRPSPGRRDHRVGAVGQEVALTAALGDAVLDVALERPGQQLVRSRPVVGRAALVDAPGLGGERRRQLAYLGRLRLRIGQHLEALAVPPHIAHQVGHRAALLGHARTTAHFLVERAQCVQPVVRPLIAAEPRIATGALAPLQRQVLAVDDLLRDLVEPRQLLGGCRCALVLPPPLKRHRQVGAHPLQPAGHVLARLGDEPVRLLRVLDVLLGLVADGVHDRVVGRLQLCAHLAVAARAVAGVILLAALGVVHQVAARVRLLLAARLAVLSAEVVIRRVHPFVRQRPRAAHLRQVYDAVLALVVSARTAQSLPARAERQRQIAVQPERARRHVQHVGQVHQRVVGVVHDCLPLVLRFPLAELDCAETEVGQEVVARGVPRSSRRTFPPDLVRARKDLLAETGAGLDDLDCVLSHVAKRIFAGRELLADHLHPLAVRDVAPDGVGDAAVRLRCQRNRHEPGRLLSVVLRHPVVLFLRDRACRQFLAHALHDVVRNSRTCVLSGLGCDVGLHPRFGRRRFLLRHRPAVADDAMVARDLCQRDCGLGFGLRGVGVADLARMPLPVLFARVVDGPSSFFVVVPALDDLRDDVPLAPTRPRLLVISPLGADTRCDGGILPRATDLLAHVVDLGCARWRRLCGRLCVLLSLRPCIRLHLGHAGGHELLRAIDALLRPEPDQVEVALRVVELLLLERLVHFGRRQRLSFRGEPARMFVPVVGDEPPILSALRDRCGRIVGINPILTQADDPADLVGLRVLLRRRGVHLLGPRSLAPLLRRRRRRDIGAARACVARSPLANVAPHRFSGLLWRVGFLLRFRCRRLCRLPADLLRDRVQQLRDAARDLLDGGGDGVGGSGR